MWDIACIICAVVGVGGPNAARCACVFTPSRAHAQTHTGAQAQARPHTLTHTHAHTHTHTRARTQTLTHTRARTHTDIHSSRGLPRETPLRLSARCTAFAFFIRVFTCIYMHMRTYSTKLHLFTSWQSIKRGDGDCSVAGGRLRAAASCACAGRTHAQPHSHRVCAAATAATAVPAAY